MQAHNVNFEKNTLRKQFTDNHRKKLNTSPINNEHNKYSIFNDLYKL